MAFYSWKAQFQGYLLSICAASIRHSADVKAGVRESLTVARHASAAFRAFAAGPGARFHPIQFFATFRTGIANFGTDPADMTAQP